MEAAGKVESISALMVCKGYRLRQTRDTLKSLVLLERLQ